jgi:hypothetical protein
MNTSIFRSLLVVLALVTILCVTSNANAQCCGGATTAFYQPAAQTAYSPVVYTANTGWYPGYFLDRVRARLWGAPATYVAAYPSTYVAAYPSTYVAAYPSYTASYSPCSTCAPAPQVTLRPVSTTCCDPCATCSSCSSGSAYGVSQTSYQESSGCACNGGSSHGTETVVVPNGTVETPGIQAPSNGLQPPAVPQTFESTPRSTERPLGEGLEPTPAGNNGGATEGTQNGTTNSSGAYFEAPELFSPQDRAAQSRVAPVKMALYEQPIRHHRVSAKPLQITAQQAELDAAGWRSASE